MITPDDAAGGAMRGDTRRRRRPKLDRTAPIRNAATYLRGDDGQPLQGVRGLVERTIELAYEVVEDQLRAGQKLARRARGEEKTFKRGAVRQGDWVGRTLRVYQEIGLLGIEAIETLTRRQGALALVDRLLGDPRAPRSGAPPRAGGAAPSVHPYAIEISSRRFASASLELHAARVPVAPKIDVLHGRNMEARISGERVRFLPDQNVVRIAIDADQPPGFYSGPVFDGDGEVPVGLLWVKVRPDATDSA